MRRRTAMPDVSIVITTYNSRFLLPETLAALAEQTMRQNRFEVLVVDDGSTDETWQYLQQRAQIQSNLTFWRQPHSGTPSAGRNAGMRRARGRYLFFNDADDHLTPDALTHLVAVADREGSDVVIGRTQRSDGKHIPARPAGVTVLDADLIDDGIWRSLSPHKLFRRDLVSRLKLNFWEDMVQGEDQVFVAACLLGATKVSILRDGDYYIRCRRPDGGNLSRQPQTLHNKWLTTSRMVKLIVRATDPGPRRDAYLERIFFRTLAPALGRPFQAATMEERRIFLAGLASCVLPYLSEALLSRADDGVRERLLLARSTPGQEAG